MSSKLFVVCGLAAVAVSMMPISAVHAQTAARIGVNQLNQDVQKPVLPAAAPAAGISYTQTGPGSGLLKAYTQGFLFCGNPSPPGSGTVTLLPAHEDQSFTPAANAHPWAFASALDAAHISYAGASLNVNRNANGVQWTSLVCSGAGALGEPGTGLFDGIFRDGLDSATETNYSHMVNWTPDPQLGFDWNQPSWDEVPANPCAGSANAGVTIKEDVACVAATGVRPAGGVSGPNPLPQRAGTVWTDSHDAVKFTYLFRVDVRAGAEPAPQMQGAMSLPTLLRAGEASAAFGSVLVSVIDAYDASFLSGSGTYCLLADLPATLGSGVCNGNPTSDVLPNGPLSMNFGVYPAPLGTGNASFYVAVVRNLVGNHPNYDTPVVGVSVLIDSATLIEGGDRFTGDDVAFGFMTPTSSGSYGFPWMREP